MTVYSEVNKIIYIGSSEQTLYPIPFEYINNDNIVVSIYDSNNVFLETWTYSTEYVVEGENIRVLDGYQIDNGKKMLIERKLDIVQDNKYREGGDFPAKSTETSFDKLTMIAQQQNDELRRCPKLDSVYSINAKLPAPDAGKALVWNSNANGFSNSTSNIDDVESITKQYRDEALASKEAAKTSEINAKSSENKALQYANQAQSTATSFDSHAAEKQSQFDTNAASKTNEYNTNAQTKLDSYNSNATSKTNAFNTNASTKTTAFNDNYTNKLNSFNSNATSKKDEFNANAIQKQEEVDTSAEEAAQSALIATTAVAGFTSVVNEQTNIFNSNASSKTADFNDNYTNKLNSFNTNAASKQSQVDESADLAESWAIGDINNRPEGSAKYWAEQASSGQIQADWSETDLESKAFIKNKPTKLSQFTNDVNFVNETQLETKQDILTTEQLSAVNSGITSNKVSTYDGYSAQISARQLTSNLSQTIDTSTSKYPSNNAVKNAIENIDVFGAGHIGQIGYTTRTDVPEGCAWCNGAEYTKASFPDVYNLLVNGKLQKTDYTTYNNSVSSKGFCGFFALDTTNQKFKVPKLLDKFVMDVDASIPVKGDGKTLGLTNGSINIGISKTASKWELYGSSAVYGANISTTAADGTIENGIFGVTTDPTKSGLVADTTSGKKVAVEKAYVVLYSSAVEASTAQAAEFIESLSTKANTDLSNVSSNIDYIVEKGGDRDKWYRKWKSGRYEQGGTITVDFSGTITFLKPFTTVPSVFITSVTKRPEACYEMEVNPNSVSTTNFTISSAGYGGSKVEWYALNFV